MKKILIATTALVATAGMASADITITGHAAAGIYSGLSATAAVKGVTLKSVASTTDAATSDAGAVTAGTYTAPVGNKNVSTNHSSDDNKLAAVKAVDAAKVALADHLHTAGTDDATLKSFNADTADLEAIVKEREAELAIINGSAASASGDGVYSSAGVDFTMTGATDNGISFSATVNIDAGTEVDTGDFELDGVDTNAVSFGSVSMSGTFGTLTFDDNGIDNLYDDDNSSADVSYSTTIGAVALSVAHNTADVDDANSMSASYAASGMTFTLSASEDTAGTSNALSVAYALNDTISLTGSSDQAAGAESVQTIGATTTLNGVSVSVSSANDSTWDVDLGYTAGGYALTYGVDETDGWTATATTALGGGATFAAGVSSDDEMYAGVSFAF